jgi:hypothetical protein
MPENLGTTPATGTDCAVGISRGIVGSQWRARWTMIDADADGNFTWSLIGYAL